VPPSAVSAAAGSPPRARGTALLVCRLAARLGITPACAGNRRGWRLRRRRGRDHPRVRGEQCFSSACRTADVGSPPRARGTVHGDCSSRSETWITPACAGNSSRRPPTRSSPGDHPRVRGEQGTSSSSGVLSAGSPPRARGTEAPAPVGRVLVGITPACAGNRYRHRSGRRRRRDHPRVRGEQPPPACGRTTPGGSPPRARGTGEGRGVRSAQSRITPACAGNSLAAVEHELSPKDHPRVRGEQGSTWRPARSCRGSPPRARGTG